jgi:hypothetical protein
MRMRKLLITLFILSIAVAIFLYSKDSTYKCKFRRNFLNIEKLDFIEEIKLSHKFQDVDKKCKSILDSYNDIANKDRALGYWYSYHGWE